MSDDEKAFCNFVKEHKQEVMLYNLQNELYVITNGCKDDVGYIIDHKGGQITFKNFGAPITKIHIDYINIRCGEELCRYEGKESSNYTEIILPNETITFIVDAVAYCKMGEEEYKNLKDWSMFKDLVPDEIPFDQYEIQITLWNQYNQEFIFKIKLYKEGRRFYRDVIQLKNK